MKKLQKDGLFLRGLAAAALALVAATPVAKAVPFASGVTNTSGTISFVLNEPGGNVTVTYDDGSTNASYNGVTTGTNLVAGLQAGFSLTGHTSYSISVQKNGSGAPSLIASRSFGTARGVAVNQIPTSPYFGRTYEVNGNSSAGVWIMNSDLSLVNAAVQTAGLTFPGTGFSSTLASPDFISVAPDGFLLLNDESPGNATIYRLDPNCATSQVVLGPVGSAAGETAGTHGIIVGPPIMTGSLANGNAVLYTVDGDLSPAGSIQVYNIGSGPLPWNNPPNATGAQISIAGETAEALGGNEEPGFTMGPGPNNYIYASTFRATPGSANFVTITDHTGITPIWSSEGESGYPLVGTPPTGDWFYQPGPNGVNPGELTASAVSPDGAYLVTLSVDNYFIIAPLTNGIPNTSAIFTVAPTTYTGNGRSITWDAADNIVMSSSGVGGCQTWSLGITATAITTGNSSGTTGFTLAQPATTVSVVATQPNASQGGVNGTVGTPVPGAFSVNRFSTSGYGSPQTVNYILGGTATTAGGVYTVSGGTTNSVIIPAGQTNAIVTITPTTNNVPRATTTVTLSLAGGAGYSVAPPFSDTVTIQNTSSQQIVLGTNAPTMYRAYSNDYAAFTVTRLGDTNAATYTVNTFFPALSSTAIQGTDFTAPTNITFNPGELVHTNQIFPLTFGVAPVDATNTTFIGNLTAVIGVTAGSGYGVATNTATLTSIDNANPPAKLLWSNPLTSASDSNNWVITAANGNMNVDTNDYEVTFGYDLTSANPNYGFNGLEEGIVGLPPSGATTCLRITCNKDGTIGCNGGVNAFPVTAPMFSGNYAVRFNMNIVQGANAGFATEGPLFGINHLSLGVTTNWFTGSGFTSFATNNGVGLTNWADDGVWFWVDGSAGGETDGDFVQFTGINHTFPNTGFSATIQGLFAPNFANVFKNPAPFNTDSAPGIPANESPNAAANVASIPANVWDDVEIKQINNIVTMSINKTTILVYTNISGWVSGVPMLGYDDPFNSVQNEDGAAYFSNIRAVQIGAPAITQTVDAGGTITIRFVSQDGDDTTSSFSLLSSGTSNTALNVDTVVANPTFTQLASAGGAFQVTVPTPTNKATFYRIKHK